MCLKQANARWMTFAGQPAARLNHCQAIFKVSPRRSLLIKMLSPLLFFAPDTHIRKLEYVFIDEMINESQWKSYIRQLQEDWKDLMFYVRNYPTIVFSTDRCHIYRRP